MNRITRLSGLMVLGASLMPAPAGEWGVSVRSDTTPQIDHRHAPVVRAGYCFWGAKWKYAGSRFRVDRVTAEGRSVSGQVALLGLKVSGTIRPAGPSVLKYTYHIDAAKDLADIIGGGLEFRLGLDSPAFAAPPGEPKLLADNRGWTWPAAKGQSITVSFDPPIAQVYFERGQKHQIRAMFLGTQVSKGRHTVAMTVSLPPGTELKKSAAERYGPADTSTWYENALPHDRSPVDVSFLNEGHKPAGRHGFVTAKGDGLVFADGTPVRFWAGNIAAYAIFADKEQIKTQARRIAQLGYNLMRFHHHDSTRWVSPTVIDKKRDDSQHLDAQAMNRLDWWIRCLKDEGVYVWLDLHVGRQFKDADGITEGFDEIRRKGGEIKGFCYYNRRVMELMRAFNDTYLRHVNPYTKLAYKDDPAVMGLLITNENDLTHHFGNLMLPDKNNPVHNRLFMKALKAFCTKTHLPEKLTWQTWLPGPSKIFLNHQEHLFNAYILAGLKDLGVRVPVATTNYWGRDGLHSLPVLAADSTVIDAHSYGGAEALSTNPRYQANFIGWIAPAQVCGRPLAITEWNVPYPAVDRFTAPLYMMSVSALQGWDAPMIYNYSQRHFDKPSRPYKWSTFSDPALTGLMPAAAVAFRQGHVSPAKRTYCLLLDRKQTYYQALDPAKSATIRTLAEQSRLFLGLPDIKELDWDRPAPVAEGATIVRHPDKDFIPARQAFVRSDTGQLRRDWAKGVQTIDTPKTQAAQGWVGGEAIRLGDVSLALQTPKAAVVLTSLDGAPIAQSKRILLTAMARVVPKDGRMPFLSEPVRGTVTLRSRAADLALVPLAGDGRELTPLKLQRGEAGRYVIDLPAPRGTHWFLLKPPG